jgi:hypothetical protein
MSSPSAGVMVCDENGDVTDTELADDKGVPGVLLAGGGLETALGGMAASVIVFGTRDNASNRKSGVTYAFADVCGVVIRLERGDFVAIPPGDGVGACGTAGGVASWYPATAATSANG